MSKGKQRFMGEDSDMGFQKDEPKAADTAPVAAPVSTSVAPAPESALPMVGLDVFCAASGLKFDQVAGFSRWAKSQGYTALTIPGWRVELEKFKNRPV